MNHPPSDFFRFPHTPHLAWLGQDSPRDDKVLSSQEGQALLAHEVWVEEKLDGANLGISLDLQGQLRCQNRGQYLQEPFGGQFSRLPAWLAQHHDPLRAALGANLILFGEWCAARHSLDYVALPDWWLVFDVYDKAQQRFWSVARRNALVQGLGLAQVPTLAHGKSSLAELKAILSNSQSQYSNGPLEGVIVRYDSADWCEARAKLVCADFTQSIGEHWRKRGLKWNRLGQRVVR